MEIDKVCRACLRKDDKMIDMSVKDIYQKLLLFANLTVEEIPDIPLNICVSCEQKLNNALDFKEKCQNSHEILLNYVKKTCEVKLEATDEVDSEPTADVNTPSRLEQFSQNQVLEVIKDLKQSICKNTNCIWCGYIGRNSIVLSRHISLVHKDLKQHWCCICNAEFDNLTDHVAIKHRDDYTCKFCSRKFQSITRLTDHLRNHSDVKPFRCSFCKKYFIKQSYLNAHLRKHTKEKPFICGSCGKSFTQRYWLKNHLVQVHKCEGDADKQLAALELKKHMRMPINNAPHKCTYCDKQFKIRSHLIEHERKHTGEVHKSEGDADKQLAVLKTKNHMQRQVSTIHMCTYCDKKFRTRTYLVEHERLHTGDKPFVCQVCGKRFGYKCALKLHMMVHNIGNRISCNICDKTFSRPHLLDTHLRNHTGEKPFLCTECGKAFVSSHNLYIHNKIHSDVRPYQCYNCDKLFKRKTHLKRHMLIHSGEKLYKCNQCSCAYKRGDSLTQHMKQHEVDKPQADRPHVCLMCNRSFTTNALLMSHIKTHTVSFLEI